MHAAGVLLAWTLNHVVQHVANFYAYLLNVERSSDQTYGLDVWPSSNDSLIQLL